MLSVLSASINPTNNPLFITSQTLLSFSSSQLAQYADLYVNDAFGTAHRAHASTEGVTKFLSPSVAGFLLQKELDYLDGAVANPKRPFVAIVGGSKVGWQGFPRALLGWVSRVLTPLMGWRSRP